jgi:hypothetical protein
LEWTDGTVSKTIWRNIAWAWVRAYGGSSIGSST